ncbi:hypothetical protein [uncultured Clostridium sp.]|uniref:hypothetical protein n=1 Tax=uncultured Clostridium sp. TaxID=59620 RepID=UPI0028E1E286|nr:hypothetical protein [uncultured Clostridium sp.]
MKIQTIKERIKKAEEKLTKVSETLKRHKIQLEKKCKVLIDNGIDVENYNRCDYMKSSIYWDICDYEHKLADIKNNEDKIEEINKTLQSLQDQLEKQIAKDTENNNLIPEALNIFLEKWKQNCMEFFIRLANDYISLISIKSNEYEITKKELELLQEKEYDSGLHKYILVSRYTADEINHILTHGLNEYQTKYLKKDIRARHIKEFSDRHFASDMYVVGKIIDNNATINKNNLNYILDEEVKEKKEMFINRVKQVIGEIKDLTNLQIKNGEVNGIAKGVKCNAKVNTISAGGKNIQCFHFRVLVNTVK